MKAFIFMFLALSLSSAKASWMVTKCSNSDGSVTWERGSDQNIINLKYANFVEGTLTLDINQVNIQLTKEVTLSEKNFRNCTYSAHTRVYAGVVKITPADKHPDVLQSTFPENSVKTEVICTLTADSKRDCNEE